MIKLYDTRRRQKVDFEPVEPGKVSMYVCGPTVYNRIHIGNARTFISFDMIRRYLSWRGFDVTFVQNVTDVDDKIIRRAAEEARTAAEVAEEYTRLFIEDMHAADVQDPDIRPKATEEIGTMIALIERLIERGHAYVSEGDVYFDVRSYPGYGQLSGRDVDEAESGHRELRADGQGLEERKRDELDFALWKAAKPGEPAWESPWGEGRPGWHIECSAMSEKYLGLPFDIHGGGADLVFPHHENERAQSECACDSTFANYWMHSGMLQIANAETGETEKMSKSLGNGLSVPAVLAENSAWVVRYALGSVQYRSMLEWSDQTLTEAQSAYDRVSNFIERAGAAVGGQPSREEIVSVSADELPADFVAAMNDDINVSGASAAIFTAIRSGNTLLSKLADRVDSDVAKDEVRAVLVNVRAMLDTLGLDPLAEPWVSEGAAGGTAGAGADSAEHTALDRLVSEQLEERAEARKAKDFARADAIRDALGAAGIAIEDTPQGPTWTLK